MFPLYFTFKPYNHEVKIISIQTVPCNGSYWGHLDMASVLIIHVLQNYGNSRLSCKLQYVSYFSVRLSRFTKGICRRMATPAT